MKPSPPVTNVVAAVPAVMSQVSDIHELTATDSTRT
jgi:hypothetical protein